MGATFTETLGGAGSWAIDFEWSPDLAAEILDFRHVLIYLGAELYYAGVILGGKPSRKVLSKRGRGLRWHLGSTGGKDGPVIEDREYLSGTNKLSNPSFSFTDALGEPQYWKRSEQTKIGYGGVPHTGTYALRVVADLGKDDVIVSTEEREARAGEVYRLAYWAMREAGPAFGKVRARLICTGRFDPQNLLPAITPATWVDLGIDDNATNTSVAGGEIVIGPIDQPDLLEPFVMDPDWEDTSDTPGDVVLFGDNSAVVGPVTQPQFVRNPSFENGGGADQADGQPVDWYGNTGDIGSGIAGIGTRAGTGSSVPHSGEYEASARADAVALPGVSHYYIQADCKDDGIDSAGTVSVSPGETYLLRGWILQDLDVEGDAFLSLVIFKAGPSEYKDAQKVNGNQALGSNIDVWHLSEMEFEVRDEDVLAIGPLCNVVWGPRDLDFTFAGTFEFDDVTLTRIKGNRARMDSPSFDITPKEKHRLTAEVQGSWPASGPNRLGTVVLSSLLGGDGVDDKEIATKEFDASGSTNRAILEVEFTPDDGYDTVWAVTLEATDLIGGNVGVENLRLIKLTGNLAERALAEEVTVVPEKPYELTARIRSHTVTGGSAWLRVRYMRTGADDVVLDLPAHETTKGAVHLISQRVTAPSGYDRCLVSAVGKDVLGGEFHFSNVTLTLAETNEVVFDVLTGAAHTDGEYRQFSGTFTAPAGTEKVRVAGVVEQGGTAWYLDDFELVHVGPVPDVTAIVGELLKHPDTGLSLLGAGVFHPAGKLLYDWRILNDPTGSALDHLCSSGLLDAPREYRINPNGTVDFGLATELYTVRDDFILAGPDLTQLDEPDIDLSAEELLQRVKIIGAELTPRRQDLPTVRIEGEATDYTGGALDWFGNPIRRTRILEDSRADKRSLAAALAAYRLEQANAKEPNVSAAVGDWRSRGRLRVGDWCFGWKPESGVEDLANPKTWRGGTIFPKQLRLLQAEHRMARGPWRVELRRAPGDTIDVSRFVKWEKATSAALTLGTLRPDFVSDPQGGGVGLQFLRFRSSRAR